MCMVCNQLRKEISEPLEGYSDHQVISGRAEIEQLFISSRREKIWAGYKIWDCQHIRSV